VKFAAISKVIFLLLLIVVLSGCGVNKQKDSLIFKNITVQEAAEFIKENRSNSHLIILDVRTPEEFNAGHMQNAVNLDFYSPTFKEELGKLDKNKIFFVYCRTGNRSGQAMEIMKSLDFKEVYNLSGGIADWVAGGFPVVPK
jgi:rhodanese-related sulfurtransferase